ncbi:caspase family protein [Streptomyces xanthii]|uniref:Caspase family protein n=1 Tax=Streptomyces xanthii TaxID=2768069 RepID=A0A7H1BAB3_9ACTN|nr:caspase family protein [Streptomyces xanthii]QNS05668.1 caspase family protein [Streptomyces xanthii]
MTALPATDQERSNPLTAEVLLIGVDSYPHSDLAAVPAARTNVERLSSSFQNGTLWGVSSHNITEVFNPSRAALLDAVERAAYATTRRGTAGFLVLYFTGHSHWDGYESKLYLTPHDGDSARVADTMVPVSEIVARVESENPHLKRKLLVLDTCFAGGGIKELPSEGSTLGEEAGWYVMASSAQEDTSKYAVDRDTTFFTGALLQTFDGVPGPQRSLSPVTVYEKVLGIVQDTAALDPGTVLPLPQHAAPPAWAQEPWLCNREYRPPPSTPFQYAPTRPTEALATAPVPLPLPSGFPAWPVAEPLFTGHTDELTAARGRFGQRRVLPVHGPHHAGKSAFVRHLLAAPELRQSAPLERPWLLLQLRVLNASAESPLLEALAGALDIGLQDLPADTDLTSDARRDLVVERLRDHARGRTLLLVVDCGRLGYEATRNTTEVDELLAHPCFQNTAAVVITRHEFGDLFHSRDQFERQVPLSLGELSTEEATSLLSGLLDKENVSIDCTQVFHHVTDPRLRLPGMLSQSAKGYVDRRARAACGDDPEDVAAALVEGSTLGVAEVLLELGCRITPGAETPAPPDPLAALVVWSLADRLELPEQALRHPTVGLARGGLLEMLTHTRLIQPTSPGRFVLGQATEYALRSLVIAVLGREQARGSWHTKPVVPPPLLDSLFPAGLTIEDLDRRLAVASAVFTLGAPDSASADQDDSARYGAQLRTAMGWIEDEEAGENRLPGLHNQLRAYVHASYSDNPYRPASDEPLAEPPALAAAAQPPAEDARPDLPDDAEAPAPGPHPPEAAPGPAPEPEPDPEVAALAASLRLHHEVATLTLAARGRGPAAETGERFTDAARRVAGALKVCDPEHVPHTLLRTADSALALVGSRLGLRSQLVDVRTAAVPVVRSGAHRRGPGQAGRITLAVSWLLNTADALIDADQLDQARQYTEEATALALDGLPPDDGPRSASARLQLRSRIALVSSRLQNDQASARATLLEGARCVADGLRLAKAQGQQLGLWTSRLLDIAQSLRQQCDGDEELDEVSALVLDTLRECHGEQTEWPAALRIRTARFLRKVCARRADADQREQGAYRIVRLLEPLLAVPPERADEGAQILAATAQAYGFLAHTLRRNGHGAKAPALLKKAEEAAREAVRLAPSVFTHSVWLQQCVDIRRTTRRTGPAGDAAARQRRECLTAVREWLTRQNARTPAHAGLDLRCTVSDWAEEGSLRAAAQKQLHGEDFLSIPAYRQRPLIDHLYRQRKQRLANHVRRYGPSVDQCLMETGLEREYRRWAAVLDYREAKWDYLRGATQEPPPQRPLVDNTPLFALCAEAAERWPHNARLIANEASLNRYVWTYNRSVSLFTKLARTAPDGETRRGAHVAAAEALLADLEYTTQARRKDWQWLLEAARGHLDAVLTPSSLLGLAMVLRARVAIRLGEEIDWRPIDDAFQTVVGGAEYPQQVTRHLETHRHGRALASEQLADLAHITVASDGAPEQQELLKLFGLHTDCDEDDAPDAGPQGPLSVGDEQDRDIFLPGQLGELLLTEFTSEKLLTGLGKLYLDRGFYTVVAHVEEHGAEPEPGGPIALEVVEHARRAYDCFDATRILQEAHGTESTVTKFERGRAITLAARYLGNSDPIPRSLPHERTDQLNHADRLLRSARDHSVGGFFKVCEKAAQENATVRHRLEAAGPPP